VAVTLATPARGSEPDLTQAVAAYLTLEEWVRALDPPGLDEPAAALSLDRASAACVILRHRGKVMSIGVEGGAAGADGGALLVRRAAGRAISELLGRPEVAGLDPEMRAGVGRSLTIELSIAGEMVALAGRTYGRIAEQIEPGLDGIALRREDRFALRFPAQFLAANDADAVERTIPALAAELELPGREYSELVSRFGVRAYRFRALHLVQRAPGRPPFAAFRGQVIVPQDQVSPAGIVAFAEGIVDHLITSLWTHGEQPVGLMGDYDPVANAYAPLAGPPREQAIAAFALLRYAQAPQLTEAQKRRAHDTAGQILRMLSLVDDHEEPPLENAGACAAIVCAATEDRELATDPDIGFVFRQAARVVRDAVAPVAGAAAPRTPHDRALVAAALGKLARSSADPEDVDRARKAIQAAWISVPVHERMTLLPWIAWAEADLASAANTPRAADEVLTALLEVVAASRIVDADAPADVAGGLSLYASGHHRADAQGSRPAAFEAWVIREAAIVPPDAVPGALAGHLTTVRFLMQLAVDDDLLWAVPTPQRALGGIRAAPWSAAQPLGAQGMALLTAAESLQTIATAAKRGP
jgi:hypothetical protein